MPQLFEDTERTVVTQRVWAATIASNAVDFLDPVDVVIPGIDGTTRWEDCPWQTRDNLALPKRGDDCVVVLDNNTKVTVVAWWPSTRSPTVIRSPIVSGPPVAPNDGDVWYAVSPATGYAWQFVYDAGWTTDIYKWKFMGGSEGYQQIAAQQTRPGSSAIGDLGTVGPSMVIVRPGVFHVRWGSLMNTGTSSSGGYAGSVISNSTGTRLSAYEADSGSTGNSWLSAMTEEEITIDPAVTIKMQYFNTGNQTATFGNRWLSVIPLRIK